MILHRLCSLARIYPRRLAAVQPLNVALGKHLPATLTQASRAYGRIYDDDDDDFVSRSVGSDDGNRRYGGGNRSFGHSGRNAGDRNRGFGGSQNRPSFGGFQKRQSFGGSQNRQSFGGSQNRQSFGGFQNSPQQVLEPIDWSQHELVEFKKDFYEPDAATQQRSAQEIEQFRAEHSIMVPQSAPRPIFGFGELSGLPAQILETIRRDNFANCTPIQAQGMPIALSGQNMVGIAQTGSGKTLAYIIPALVHILNQPRVEPEDGPIALVLAPTRELAVQIGEVANKYGSSAGIKSVVLYGGANRARQVSQLQQGVSLVIATPGRLNDLINTSCVRLQRCTYFVLDEADRMLDMGFEPQVRQIESQIRPDRQTLMWSATWPRAIRRLANDFLGKQYMNLTVGSDELSLNPDVEQLVHVCSDTDKYELFSQIMRGIQAEGEDNRKTLVFVQTKRGADQLAQRMEQNGLAAAAIHGNCSQMQRDQIIRDFRNDHIQMVVATDVASRGLDVNNVKHVINFDFPQTIADFVHRIGRTGRAGRKGTAHTLFSHADAALADELIELLKRAGKPVDQKLAQLGRGGRSRW